MPNRFTPIQAGTDPNQQLAVINKNFAELDNESVKKLYYDSSGIPSIQIGVQSDGSSAIKVSQPGIDVTTATNSQLAFNSAQNVFKVVNKVASVIPAFTTNTGGAHYALLTIKHNLSYIPLVNIYVAGHFIDFGSSSTIATSRIPLPISVSGLAAYYFPASDGSDYPLSILYAVDATNIYIQAFSPSTSGTITTITAIPVTCFILQETAS